MPTSELFTFFAVSIVIVSLALLCALVLVMQARAGERQALEAAMQSEEEAQFRLRALRRVLYLLGAHVAPQARFVHKKADALGLGWEVYAMELVEHTRLGIELLETIISGPKDPIVPHDLNYILNRVGEGFPKQAQLDMFLPGHAVVVLAPERQLIQALHHLMLHAVNASAHTNLRVVLTEDGGRGRITMWRVEDALREACSMAAPRRREPDFSMESTMGMQMIECLNGEVLRGRARRDPTFEVSFPLTDLPPRRRAKGKSKAMRDVAEL